MNNYKSIENKLNAIVNTQNGLDYICNHNWGCKDVLSYTEAQMSAKDYPQIILKALKLLNEYYLLLEEIDLTKPLPKGIIDE